MQTKNLVLAASAVALFGIALLSTATSVSAQNDAGSSLVDRIAQKFNLNKDDVQQVFDGHRTEMKTKHRERQAEWLDQAVTDGTITPDQKDQLLNKLEELANTKESLQELGHDERHDKMRQQREQLEAWAKEHDIPLDLLYPGHGKRHFMR